MSKKEQFKQTTANQLKEGKTDYTETKSLLASSEQSRLLIGLEDVRNKTDCIAAIYDLVFVVENNQSEASVIVMSELVRIANQKITQHLKILKTDKQNSIDVETQYSNNNKLNNGSEELVQSISRLLTEIQKRSPQLVEENQDQVFNPLIQMMYLVDSKTLPINEKNKLQQQICNCIISLLSISSPQAQTIIEEKCIPFFQIDLAKQLVLNYVSKIPNRLHSFFGPRIIDALTKRMQSRSEELSDDKKKEIIFQIFNEANISFPIIVNFGHEKSWANSLIRLNSTMTYGSDWYRNETSLSDKFIYLLDSEASEILKINSTKKPSTRESILYSAENAKVNIDVSNFQIDSSLYHAFESRLNQQIAKFTIDQAEKLHSLLLDIFLDICEPPPNSLAKFKKENFFKTLEIQNYINQLLNIMLHDNESYRYQIGAILTIFPKRYLSKENLQQIGCISNNKPFNLSVGYIDRNLCPSTEERLWASLFTGTYLVVNRIMVLKLEGKKTALCTQSFCNSEGYVFYKGIFYSLNQQDQQELFSKNVTGQRSVEMEASEWSMMRGIFPYKGISGDKQIEEIRNLIRLGEKNIGVKKYRGLELTDYLKYLPIED